MNFFGATLRKFLVPAAAVASGDSSHGIAQGSLPRWSISSGLKQPPRPVLCHRAPTQPPVPWVQPGRRSESCRFLTRTPAGTLWRRLTTAPAAVNIGRFLRDLKTHLCATSGPQQIKADQSRCVQIFAARARRHARDRSAVSHHLGLPLAADERAAARARRRDHGRRFPQPPHGGTGDRHPRARRGARNPAQCRGESLRSRRRGSPGRTSSIDVAASGFEKFFSMCESFDQISSLGFRVLRFQVWLYVLGPVLCCTSTCNQEHNVKPKTLNPEHLDRKTTFQDSRLWRVRHPANPQEHSHRHVRRREDHQSRKPEAGGAEWPAPKKGPHRLKLQLNRLCVLTMPRSACVARHQSRYAPGTFCARSSATPSGYAPRRKYQRRSYDYLDGRRFSQCATRSGCKVMI